MSTYPETDDVVRPPRLNPFAFPSDTTFRFALLVVSIIGTSLLLNTALYNTIPATSEWDALNERRCAESLRAASPTDAIASGPEGSNAFNRCFEPAERVQAAWLVGGLALLLSVAGALYWAYPVWKIRREGLLPLSAENAPEGMVAYLKDLCREAGLSHPPTFLLDPLNPSSSGLAFGRFGRYYVALNGGLLNQFKDRPAFRAVVLHELAHLRNADVNKTYLTKAIWWAFVAAILVPFGVSLLLLDWPLETLFSFGWRVLALTALVLLTRNAVLRAREVYADVRASTWDGPAGALGRALESLPRPKAGRWSTMVLPGRWLAMVPVRWLTMTQVHPDPDERRRLLDDTRPLFRMGFWEAFGTGVATTVVFGNVEFLLNLVVPPAYETLSTLGSGLIFASLVVGVVGLSGWRATFAALAQGETPRGAGRLGLALGLGMFVGQKLSLTEYAYSQGEIGLMGWELLAFDVVWGGLLLASMFLFMRWIAAGASPWLEAAAASDSPRLFYWLGLIIPSTVLAAWLGVLYFHVYTVRAVGFEGAFSSPSFVALTEYLYQLTGSEGPLEFVLLMIWAITPISWGVIPILLTFFALAGLWAYPLAARFWRGRVSSAPGSSWAFLDSSSQQLTLPQQPPLRFGLAAKIGLIGGVVVLWAVSNVPALLDRQSVFVLIVLMQVGVAAVVAGWVRRLESLNGLCAAFLSGCVVMVGILGLDLLYGDSDWFLGPWGIWIIEYIHVATGGALLALPTAFGVSALARRLRPAEAPTSRVPSRPRAPQADKRR